MKITVSTRIKASAEKVWALYTSAEAIKQWNTASPDWHTTQASIDLRVGGHFSSRMEAKDGSMGFDFAGTYTEIKAPEFLAYRFGERSATVSFTAVDDDAIQLTVCFDAETIYPAEQQQAGWQAILDNFALYVINH